jgi:periplasmic protein TonB
MLGVLLESRARRPRRSGGMALSVATHLALIAGATAATAGLPRTAKPVRPPIVQLTPPAPKPIEPRHVVDTDRNTATLPGPIANIVITHVDAPTTVPVSLPPIDMTGALAADSIVIGSGPARSGGATCQLRCLYLEDKGSPGEWHVNELLMHMITPAKPRYPEMLRQAGIDGRVLVRFVVDTLGRIDPASVQILSSTHDQFTRAVRDALSGFRFRPAESNGKRIPALAEMPFEFKVDGR